ncbi:MAG: ABC-F family ATP-binding cassette domain-containing protein [Planctomycetaceae bacterium]|nr:ABC-F family ATP-binding cassette domain-containing protein [Planctomycetaceae bacterium]
MILLSVQDISKHFGPEPVLDRISFDVRKGERLSVVGPNGTGKTTLLKILANREEPDGGSRQLHPTARIGYLEQRPEFTPGRTVWQEALDALRELVMLAQEAEQLAQQLAATPDETQRARLGRRFDDLQHELHRRDAYHLDHKIERVLAGLGFPAESFQQEVTQLSGGQQNRLLLARLLLEDPDILLLDEPSNHLDLQATRWLEDYLVETSQTLLVVSHDRYFLDKVTNRTLELFQGTVDQYAGNFSAYQHQKAERLEVQRRTFAKQQTEIAKMEDFVRRHHYGQKHAQAEDRRKKLERIERVEAPREITAPPMWFPAPTRSGDIVLRAERLGKSFARPLFQDLTLDILRGEKWAVLGPNGCGKTTLIRCLLGDVQADTGRVVMGAGVKVAYFDQLLQCIDSAQTVVEAIRPTHKEFVERERRELLARFGITGDMVFQSVESLSGGERNRAALAYLAALDANLLVLDEPTNHLDLWARGALESALRQFAGTVLLVSHDRYFLNQVADHLIVMQSGQLHLITGNYDTYLHLVSQGLIPNPADSSHTTGERDARPKRPGRERPARPKRQFPYRKVVDIEHDIQACESRIIELHQNLASPDLRDGRHIKELTTELQAQEKQLEQLLAHWEEASELN